MFYPSPTTTLFNCRPLGRVLLPILAVNITQGSISFFLFSFTAVSRSIGRRIFVLAKNGSFLSFFPTFSHIIKRLRGNVAIVP